MTQFLYVLAAVSITACLLVLKRMQPYSDWAEAGSRGRTISWAILLVYLAVNILNIQTRDITALVASGLSAQNKIQIAIVLFACAWAATLCLTRRVPLKTLFDGPGYWIFWLVVVYSFSTIWSTWPSLTVFRVTELAALWIISSHVFARIDWFERVETFLWISLGIYFIHGCLLALGLVEGDSSDGSWIGSMRSNTGSLIAGLMILWTVYRCVTDDRRSHIWKLPVLTLVLLLFGSLATSISLLLSIMVLLTLHTKGTLRIALIATTLAAVLTIPNVLLAFHGQVIEPLVGGMSQAFAKPTQHITGMTGRLELWTTIWESTRNQPWGFGFAALERTFSVENGTMSWTAGNAHNGFISAWLGAGWLAVTLVIALFGALINRSFVVDRSLFPLMIGSVALVAVNNLSLPAVGGRVTIILIFVIALCHIPTCARTERQFARRQKAFFL